MLNRVINGTKVLHEKRRLIQILRGVSSNPQVDGATRVLVETFLAKLSSER